MIEFYHDRTRNLLVYGGALSLPDHFILHSHAERIGNYFAIPNTLANAQALRNLGFPVAPVMDANYDWPRPPWVKAPYEKQRLMTNFMLLHPRSFNLSDMGCVDAYTEFLSPDGWRQISMWNGEKVAQYDPDDESISFIKTQLVKKPCSEMLRLKTTRGVDQMLSFGHRVLLANGEVLSAAELAEEYGSKNRFRHKFRTTFNYNGKGLDLTDELIRLQIAVNADGSMRPTKTPRVAIRIKKKRKIQRLRRLLVASHTAYSEYAGKPREYRVFLFTPPEIKHEFQTWWQATQHQLEIIASELPHWDGTFRKKQGVGFFSTKKASADFAQFAFSVSGRRTLLTAKKRKGHIEYTVSGKAGDSTVGVFGRNGDGSMRQNIWKTASPDGFMYCFSVPTGFLLLRRNGCIFATGNTGKTLAALWAADQLMRWNPGWKALIVCPLSVMRRVWADTIFCTFLDKRKAVILHGTHEQRLKGLEEKADFYIVNFDGVGVGAHTRGPFKLDGFSSELAHRDDIKIGIIDEASAYKDSRTKRHRIARLAFGTRPYLWLITGTPTPTSPLDAYGLAKIVNNAKGKSLTTYKIETMYQPFPRSFKWLPRADGYDKARALLQPAVRIPIEEVWDGPEITTQQREVPLTDDQKKLMKDLKRHLIVSLQSGAAITAVNEAAARIKFEQLSLGAIYDQNHKAHLIDAKPRYDELIRVLEEAPGKVLVFAPLTSVIDLIYNNIKTRWGTEIVNGEVSHTKRSEIFRAFQQDAEPRIIVADPGTMSHGLDLFAARTVVWFGPTEKAELYDQANHRAHRPGQKFPVTVVQLVSNPLEREIFRRLENNLALQGALLDLVRANAI